MISSIRLRFNARVIALALVTTLAGCGGGGSSAPAALPPTGATTPGPSAPLPASQFPALVTIPEVASTNGVARLSLQAKFDDAGRPAFYYAGQKGAPTIRVRQGDSIVLHFINALPQFCAVGVVSNANLHFHGLTSAPIAPGDETISTNAAPGGAIDYTVKINDDQPPGLYWYHPHPHGLSSYEVGNGMAGAIVVEGIANEVPATSGLRERVIVLGAVPTDPSIGGAGDAGNAIARRFFGRRRKQDEDGGGDPCAADPDTRVTINGQPAATIGIRPGETELLRVVNASGHRFFDLAIDGESLTLVAQDGVPVRDYPGAPQTIVTGDLVIPPAGRAEFLVTGQAHPAALTSLCYQTGPGGDPAPEAVLGVLADDGGAAAQAVTRATAHVAAPFATVRFPKYYRTVLPAPTAQRTITFSEDPAGFYLNGKQYNPAGAPDIVAQSGTVEEWTLENDSDEVHDFHIHQVHFVVESVDGVPATAPHWVDSFTLPPQGHGASGQLHPSLVKVLIDFRDPVIRGTFLYHCHILDHEDGGMMAKIAVR